MSRKIAIVGNGLFSRGDAIVIDDCDVVVRFNDCRSIGEGGFKTNVVAVCNTGRPALSMVRQRSWTDHTAIASASELWCVRDAGRFKELKERLGPELDDFCDDYTAEFAMFAAKTAKAFKVISRRHHDRIDVELQSMTSESYILPSSGLITIAYVLDQTAGSGDEVVLAGFDHRGWSGHPFDAEHELIDGYIAQGRLRRIAASRHQDVHCFA